MTAAIEKIINKLIEHNLSFHHFTDSRNIPSIRQNRLLSINQILRKGMTSITGGNDCSQSIDTRFGMDDFVHVSFIKRHPLE
jgi:hypothetical protein